MIKNTTLSPPKCSFAVLVCHSFLHSVWNDPGAPPGNEANVPPGRVKVSSIKYQVSSVKLSAFGIDRQNNADGA